MIMNSFTPRSPAPKLTHGTPVAKKAKPKNMKVSLMLAKQEETAGGSHHLFVCLNLSKTSIFIAPAIKNAEPEARAMRGDALIKENNTPQQNPHATTLAAARTPKARLLISVTKNTKG